MSKLILCDVIGCEKPAVWRCPPTSCKITEDYLCASHYEKLRVQTPGIAQQYERIKGVKGEATEEWVSAEE